MRVEWRKGTALGERTLLGGVDAVCPELPPGALSAPAVFVGFGIREPSPARDDYRGLDLKGKVAVLYAGLPAGSEWERPELRERYAAESSRQRFAAKARLAAEAGEPPARARGLGCFPEGDRDFLPGEAGIGPMAPRPAAP